MLGEAYYEKIEMLHHIELKELFDSYGCSMNSLVNIQIGYDEKVVVDSKNRLYVKEIISLD